jgi:hypothetical protein
LLASDCASASGASWYGGLERYIGSPRLAAAIVTRNLLGDVNSLPVSSGASGINHAVVWTSTVPVNLVDGHCDLATGRDLWELAIGHGQNGLSTCLDVVVTTLDTVSMMCEFSSEFYNLHQESHHTLPLLHLGIELSPVGMDFFWCHHVECWGQLRMV